jgi:hypothetical protein
MAHLQQSIGKRDEIENASLPFSGRGIDPQIRQKLV